MTVVYDTAPTDLAWETAALCAQVDPEIFFPAQGEPGREAQRVCLSCPVLQECRVRALSFETEQWGVWGALTQRQRRKIKRQKRYDDE